MGAGRRWVPPRRCLRGPAGRGRAAGLSCGRSCYRGRHRAQTSPSGPARRTRKPLRGARGVPAPGAAGGFSLRPRTGRPRALWAGTCLFSAARPEPSVESGRPRDFFKVLLFLLEVLYCQQGSLVTPQILQPHSYFICSSAGSSHSQAFNANQFLQKY